MIIFDVIFITYFPPAHSSCFRNVETSNKNDRKNTLPYSIELKTKVLIENIPDRLASPIKPVLYPYQAKSNHLIGLSYKTITCAFCPLYIHRFGLVYLYLLYISKILPRFLMKKYIEKKKNTAVA